MPDKTPCVACQRIGFVRREHVIEKGKARIHHYCGSCEHTWTTPDDLPATRADAPDKPQRSRT